MTKHSRYVFDNLFLSKDLRWQVDLLFGCRKNIGSTFSEIVTHCVLGGWTRYKRGRRAIDEETERLMRLQLNNF